jgi:multiple sugar transport system ATP-binding protein
MGRAIVRNPRVFLFDEPLSNLDAELRLRMRTEIKQLHARLGATMVYVTHDQIEAMTLADRIVIMRAGLIQQIGTPYEVFSTPANLFVASFIGSPPMNLLCAELAGDRLLVPGWGASLPFPAGRFRRADGRALVLGIRPDHLAPVTSADGCALTLHGEVRVIEPLGADMLVFLAVAGEDRGPDSQMVSFKCPYSERLRPGQALTLGCQTAHLHLFDQDSQASLRLPVA